VYEDRATGQKVTS